MNIAGGLAALIFTVASYINYELFDRLAFDWLFKKTIKNEKSYSECDFDRNYEKMNPASKIKFDEIQWFAYWFKFNLFEGFFLEKELLWDKILEIKL